ncbi:MAG TPA: tetratricopeptide repeat protein, partial [Burkholderiales bacterium]|nr:tetratricopeptide repeat protein [Burkholderiales bacterium]
MERRRRLHYENQFDLKDTMALIDCGFSSLKGTFHRLLMPVVLLLFCIAFIVGCTKTTGDLIRSADDYQAKGDFTAAIIQLKNALAKDPDNLEGNILLGLSYAETGEAVDAERKLRRAIELGAPHARVLPKLGQMLIDTEQYAEAITELRKAKDLSGESLAEVSLLIGRAQVELKQFAEARTQYLLAGTGKPAEAKLGLARVAVAENDRNAAYKLTEEVLASAPTNVEAWIAKG